MLRSARTGGGGPTGRTLSPLSTTQLFLTLLIAALTLFAATASAQDSAAVAAWRLEGLAFAGPPLVGSLSGLPLAGQIVTATVAPGTPGRAVRDLPATVKLPAAAQVLALSLDGKAKVTASAQVTGDAVGPAGEGTVLPPRTWIAVPVTLPPAGDPQKPLVLRLSLSTDTATSVLVAVPEAPSAQDVAGQLLYLGSLLSGAARHEDALATWAQYEAAVKDTPEAGRALLYKGDALRGLGNAAGASEAYRAALAAVDPARAKPAAGNVGNYTLNRLASDMGTLIRGRLAALVPAEALTEKDVALLEELAAVWPPTPEAKQAALRLAEYRVARKQVTAQTVSYLLGIFDASGEHTDPQVTKLADNQALIDRISRPLDPALGTRALALLNDQAGQFGLGAALPKEALPELAEDWSAAEAAALTRDTEVACRRFLALARKHSGSFLAPLATLAAGQWLERCGLYGDAIGAQTPYEAVAAGSGPLAARGHLGLAELALATGDRARAQGELRQVIALAGDSRVKDWAAYRLAQCAEFAGLWDQATAQYTQLAQVRHVELAEEARMAAARLATLGKSPVAGPNPAVHYLGEDRSTQGDWYTYYGSEAFILCAQQAPADIAGGPLTGWAVKPTTGNSAEQVRYWVTAPSDDHPSMLYNPLSRVRRAANWDDRGEAYPRGTGPDLLVEVPVPAGQHRLSLYFVNDRNYYEPRRTYTISVFDAAGVYLTGAEVRSFVNGSYEQFSVTGPTKLRLLISRNLSLNVLLSGVFLDPLQPAAPDLRALGVSETEDLRQWQRERLQHLSPRAEQLRFAQFVSGAKARADSGALDSFLAGFAKSAAAPGSAGPAKWAAEQRFRLPYKDREQRLKRLVDTLPLFEQQVALWAPNTSKTQACWPVVVELFEEYLTAGSEGLKPAECEQFYRRAAAAFRHDSPLLTKQALARLESGGGTLTPADRRLLVGTSTDPAQEVARLEQAVAEAPAEGRPELQLQLVGCYLTAGRLDAAEALVGKMRAEQPKAPQTANALYNVGLAHLRAKRKEQATQYLTEVVSNFPDSHFAKYSQGYLKRMEAASPK